MPKFNVSVILSEGFILQIEASNAATAKSIAQDVLEQSGCVAVSTFHPQSPSSIRKIDTAYREYDTLKVRTVLNGV